jgi:hypothetical protein
MTGGVIDLTYSININFDSTPFTIANGTFVGQVVWVTNNNTQIVSTASNIFLLSRTFGAYSTKMLVWNGTGWF